MSADSDYPGALSAIARRNAGGQALSVLTVDSPVPDELLDEVRSAISADLFRQIEITPS